ncbi:hypothetical protein JW721_04725 [Candidatus Micrarchaeota archaeon]|nr:hypothetical protein [Candidatus Micrarchaeota archaeon]
MGGVKKGIVSTVSTVLLATAFLYLLSFTSSYSDSVKDANSRIMHLEKLNMQFDTESYGMQRLVESLVSEISWEGENVSFSGNMSSAGNGEYYAAVARFSQFSRAFGLVDSTIDLSEARMPILHIRPQNITVRYLPGKVGFYPQNGSGSSGKVASYTILIKANVPTPGIQWGDYSETFVEGPDAVYVHVGFEGTNGTVSASKYLYKYNESEIMMLNRYNQSVVGIRIGYPAELEVNCNTDIYLKTVIGLDSQGEVEVGGDIIGVGEGSWGDKVGKVMMYDS